MWIRGKPLRVFASRAMKPNCPCFQQVDISEVREASTQDGFWNEGGGQKPLTCVLRILDASNYPREWEKGKPREG